MNSLPRPPTPRRSLDLQNYYSYLEMLYNILRWLPSIVFFIYGFVKGYGIFASVALAIAIFAAIYLVWHWLKISFNRPRYPRPPSPPKR
jgi:hypothetical protein